LNFIRISRRRNQQKNAKDDLYVAGHSFCTQVLDGILTFPGGEKLVISSGQIGTLWSRGSKNTVYTAVFQGLQY
jgi:hypothetical protein